MIEPLAGQRQKRETAKAVQASNDYLRMGPGRSLRDLWRLYKESEPNQTPTQSWGTLAAWSSRYEWMERAEEYDLGLEQEKNQRRDEIMASGLALAHERVEKLKWLAAFLEGQIKEQGEDGVYHNVWLPDVKQIGGGQYVERVDIERFNSPLISEYRATLDDLAKETGGRIRKQEISGEGGGPIELKASGYNEHEWAKSMVATVEALRTRIPGLDQEPGGAVDSEEPTAGRSPAESGR